MSARNPGPKIQRMPLGFPSYSARVIRDQQHRRAFFDSEVNTRIYKAVYESFGVKGRIEFNKKVGQNKINLRCIHGGASNGISRFTHMSRFGMLQAQQEGWLFKYVLSMFDWFNSFFFNHCTSPVSEYIASTDPRDLDYETSRVMLHREPDVPFFNPYWNHPLKNTGQFIYSDKILHEPLFSSKDQIVNSECVGKLHFNRSLAPDKIAVDPTDNALLTRPTHAGIVSSSMDKDIKNVVVESAEPLKVGFRIGGAGPGGPEMSAKGELSSRTYQKFGPHMIGTKLRDGSLCIEPSTMQARDVSIHEINDNIGNPPDTLIQTS